MWAEIRQVVLGLGGLFWSGLIKTAFFLAVLLVAFGRVEERMVASVLLLLVGTRATQLLLEALPPDLTEAGEGDAPPGRSRADIALEALGLIGFVVLLPALLILVFRDVASLRGNLGWAGIATLLVCTALYAWPKLRASGPLTGRSASLWWGLPFLPLLMALVAGVAVLHPYLNPLADDRTARRAEKIMSLGDNVVASRHADWVLTYAAELEGQGLTREASAVYEFGLRLAPGDAVARSRLRMLDERHGTAPHASTMGEPDPRPGAATLSPSSLARRPFWPDGSSPPNAPRCSVQQALMGVSEVTVIIVPVGAVPPALTDGISDVLNREASLATCVATEPLALPIPDRTGGLVTGNQWATSSLMGAFAKTLASAPPPPLRFLLVTEADVYEGESRFLFSGTFGSWGAVLSSARFRLDDPPEATVHVRAAKQALAAIIRSFDLPPSADTDCVTSYANDLAALDAKGNRPTTATYLELRNRIEALNRGWRPPQPGSTAAIR
jgi:hypothetical protein